LSVMLDKNPAAAVAIANRLKDALSRDLWVTRRNSVEEELDRVLGSGS
jgi:cobaltochelatase CobN